MATNEFVLDTKQLCLMCLSEVETVGPNRQKISNTSFKSFLRYLKIDIYQLETFKSIFLSSMKHLNDKCVKVSLCVECTRMTNKFSELYAKWEKLEKSMDTCIQFMHEQMLISVRDPAKTDEYLRRTKNATELMEAVSARIVGELRKEAMEKCYNRISLAKLQYTSTSPDLSAIDETETESTPTMSTLGSFVTSLPTSGQPLQPVVDEPITPNLTSSPPTTQLADSTYVVDNEQPSTSRGLTTSKDLPQRQDLARMDILECLFDVKVERDGGLLDNHSSLSTSSRQEAYSFSDDDDDIMLLEPPLNSQGNAYAETVVSTLSASEAFVAEDSNEVDIPMPSAGMERTISVNNIFNTGSVDCSICKLQFPDIHSLILHMNEHKQPQQKAQGQLKDKSRQCEICSRVCKNQHGYLLHKKVCSGDRKSVRLRHPEDSDGHYNCGICPQYFSQDSYRLSHLATQHTLRYLETHLPPGVSQAQLDSAIEREMAKTNRHSKEAGSKYSCPHCPSETKSAVTIRAHIIRKHYNKFIFT